MKRYGAAKKYAEQVLQLADSIKSYEYIYRAHEALAISNMGLGNKEDAIHHTISALTFKDSLYSEQTAEATAAMETKYKTELKEEQIKLLSRENEIRQLTINAGKASLAKTRYVLALLALAIVVVMAIFYIRMQRLKTKQQLQLAHEREQYQKEGIAAVIQAQEQERERIARELHDNICQQLGVVRLRLQQTEAGANQSAAMLDEITKEVRDLAYQMLPVTLQQYGLAPALNELVRHSFESTNIEAVFEDMTGNVHIPDSYILALYRVAQELVSNALKHSNATLINIQLLIIKNMLVLTVEDNGKGLKDENAKRGMGMVNIRTRVEQIGGEIVIENNPGGGLRTVVKVPLKNRL
jgi:signal transduction histidine kinase